MNTSFGARALVACLAAFVGFCSLSATAGVLLSNGRARTYVEYIPASYNGSKPVPLIVYCHAGLVSGTQSQANGYFIREADSVGLIVTYPDSVYETWDIWKSGQEPDDVIFLTDLINHYLANYNIDRSRIYMAGWSEGSMMTSTYLFYRADLIAAALHYKGGWWIQTGTDPYTVSPQPNVPIPICIFRGALERQATGGIDRAVQDTANRNFWIKHNGLSLSNFSASVNGIYTDTLYTGGKAEVLYTIAAGEHHSATAAGYSHAWNTFLSRFSRTSGSTVAFDPTVTAASCNRHCQLYPDIGRYDLLGRTLTPALYAASHNGIVNPMVCNNSDGAVRMAIPLVR